LSHDATSGGAPIGAEETADREVGALLERLRRLIAQLAAERAALAPLERDIAAAWSEYQDHLKPLHDEGRRLAHKLTPAARVRPEPPPVVDLTDPTPPRVGPAGGAATQPPDPELVEKDMLLEHLMLVLDAELDEDAGYLIAVVQGRVDDRAYGLADLLESVPWGAAWTERERREDASAQRRRLERWEAALTRQLEVVRNSGARLRWHDQRYPVYEQWQRGPESWKGYLARDTAQLEEHNLELRAALKERSGEQVGAEGER
jgi:hypothetical protein